MGEGRPVLHVLGLGPGDQDLLTLGTWKMLVKADEVLVRTAEHPCVEALRRGGVRMRFLDRHYREAETLEEAYASIAREVAQAAREKGEAFYAVPGHPLFAERTVQLLLGEDLEVRLHAAVSFLDAALCSLGKEALEGILLLDGEEVAAGEAGRLNPRLGILLAQVDSRLKASEVKVTLLDTYPPAHTVYVLRASGTGEEEVEELPLEELDREERFDHLTSLYIPPLPEEEVFDFQRMVDVVSRLRGPGGCPWDRRQTHRSLARHMVEEAHEAVEAIQRGDWEHLSEELGDLLLQVVLHAQLGSEEGTFDVRDVLRLIIEKLIRRHPHVFGEAVLRTPEEVIARWERIKAEEKGEPSVLDGVAEGLPALIYAFKLQSRAARVGFDWEGGREVLPKLEEELREIEEVISSGKGDLEAELGDLLFTVVNVCRHLHVDPEVALKRSAGKFARRFREMEERCRREGRRMEDMDLGELDALWERSKDEE